MNLKIFSFILIIFLTIGCTKHNAEKHKITLWMESAPYSSDPIDVDSVYHNIIFLSVFSPLVSEYETGKLTGIVAEGWNPEQEHRVWNITIRKNLKFENGDQITAKEVFLSLRRVIFLLKQRDSHNGLFEYLVGYDQWDHLNSELTGLKVVDDYHLKLEFSKSIPNFLSLISFPMYSVVHPSLFNEKTGIWLNKRSSISSAMYRITEWNEKNVIIEKRSDWSHVFNEKINSANSVVINWDQKLKETSDLIFSTSDDNLIAVNKKFIFFGGIISSVKFVRCVSWFVPGAPCNQLEGRLKLRRDFYTQLIKLGFSPSASFFPSAAVGIKPVSGATELFEELKKSSKADLPIKQSLLRYVPSNATNPSVKSGYNIAVQQMSMKSTPVELNMDQLYAEITEMPKKASADLACNGSEFYIDKMNEDLQFIFRSKQGVYLPDTDGRIFKELNRTDAPPNIQTVNELLWDQAVIWPLVEYASGFWANPEKFDFSHLNLLRTPTQLELIGIRD